QSEVALEQTLASRAQLSKTVLTVHSTPYEWGANLKSTHPFLLFIWKLEVESTIAFKGLLERVSCRRTFQAVIQKFIRQRSSGLLVRQNFISSMGKTPLGLLRLS